MKGKVDIEEQVNELIGRAEIYDDLVQKKMLSQVENTIEILFAEEKMVSEEHLGRKSILEIETPNACIDCPCHFAEESGRLSCGAKKKEIFADDVEAFKPDWCPLKEKNYDFCNEWVACADRLPSKDECKICGGEFNVTYAMGSKLSCSFTTTMTFEYERIRGKEVGRWKWRGRLSQQEVIAWKPLPDPYMVQ